MEYLRKDKKEKKKRKKGKKKRKKRKGKKKDTKTSTEDVEAGQPIQAWSDQERKVSWLDRIKTIGKMQ